MRIEAVFTQQKCWYITSRKRENMFTREYANELDTVQFCIDNKDLKYNFDLPHKGKVLGMSYKRYQDKIFFNVSSKVFATVSTLGAITRENTVKIAEKIEQSFGIVINKDFLYECVKLCRVDVKKDRFMTENPNFYISDLRRLFKRNSDRFDVYKYKNDIENITLTYENGLAVVPKTKDNYRYSIYNKGKEVSMAQNKEFREKFDYALLNNLDFCLRSEVQLKKHVDIKSAFAIPSSKEQTFATVLESGVDVVGEELGKLFKQSEVIY